MIGVVNDRISQVRASMTYSESGYVITVEASREEIERGLSVLYSELLTLSRGAVDDYVKRLTGCTPRELGWVLR